MENKLPAVLLLAFMMLCTAVPAQEKAPEEEKNAEAQWQMLEWEERDPSSVMKYDVSIEERDPKTDTYAEINRVETKGNETYVQAKTKEGELLSPGNYRYKVITYNLLGVPETESDWYEFTIYQAYQPEVTKVSADVNLTSTLYLDERNNGIFSVAGKNLFEGPEDRNDISFTEYSLVNQKKKNGKSIDIRPEIIEHDKTDKKLTVKFDMDDIDVGVYTFTARDASGLENPSDRDSTVTVKFRKWMDLDVCAGYTVPVILFDDTMKTYMDQSAFPISACARVSFMPFKHRFGYFGISLSASYTRLFAKYDTYYIDGNMFIGHADFVYQYPVIKNRLVLELHGGGGVTMMHDISFHFSNNVNSDPFKSLNISFNAGCAAQIYIIKRVYVDVCADYVQAFMTDMALGMIVPSVSAGWQF
jgi:hypothetical protein